MKQQPVVKTSFYLFGFIKLWTIRSTADAEQLYETMRGKFYAEIDSAVARNRKS